MHILNWIGVTSRNSQEPETKISTPLSNVDYKKVEQDKLRRLAKMLCPKYDYCNKNCKCD